MWCGELGVFSKAMGNKIPYLVGSHPLRSIVPMHIFLYLNEYSTQLVIKTESDGCHGVCVKKYIFSHQQSESTLSEKSSGWWPLIVIYCVTLLWHLLWLWFLSHSMIFFVCLFSTLSLHFAVFHVGAFDCPWLFSLLSSISQSYDLSLVSLW